MNDPVGSSADLRRLVDERDAAVARAEASRRGLEALQSMMVAIAGARSTDAAIDVVLDMGLPVSGAAAGLVAIADHDAGVARVLGAVGAPADGAPLAPSFPLNGGNPIGRCVIEGEPFFGRGPDEVPAGVPAAPRPAARSAGRRGRSGPGADHGSVAVLPLPSGGATIGVLVLSFAEPQPFDDPQVQGLLALGNLAAAALVRVRLLEEEDRARAEVRRLADRNAFLAEATAVVSAPLDERTVLDRLARLCVPKLGDWCTIALPRGDVLERIIVHHHDPARAELAHRLQGRTVPLSGESPVSATFHTGRPHLLGDLGRSMAADPTFSPDHVEVFHRLGDAAGIIVPIGHASRPVGVLAFAVGPERDLHDDDLDLAVEIALRAGIAVGHAADFAREREAAALLLRAILPAELPAVAGVDLAASYRPADRARMVGGDWFDVVRLDGDRVAVAVGDVAGHGVGAAAAMGQLRHALRAYLFEGHGPGPALRRLNRLLRSDGPRHHATGIVGILDVGAGELAVANAGHVPPLVSRGDGRPHVVDVERGPMLGVFTDAEFPEQRLALSPGEAVVLFTDGLVERRRRSLDDAVADLSRAIGASPPDGSDLQGWCDALIEAQARSSDLDDDTCVLVLRMGPPAVPVSDASGQAEGGRNGEGPPLLELTLPPELGAARTVRRWLDTILAGHPRLGEVQVCATEVVTNAVVHAGTPLTVTVHRTDDRIRVAVRDASTALPERRPHRSTAPSGRGLLLVDALASAWGVEPEDHGKVVWFDFEA